MTRSPRLAALTALLLVTAIAPAQAESLQQALAAAYETNPDLGAQRAVVRQIDETVPQALAGFRPGIGASVGFKQNGSDFHDDGRVFTAGGTISQPIYNGGSTKAALSAGENRILAARAQLRGTENTVLVGVVTAYANVLALQRVVDLTGNQVKVLERELQASKDRFEVGDLTRTDVAQSDARLAASRSNLIAAQGSLNVAREAYARVVGHAPQNLEPVPPLPMLPGTLGQAVDTANVNNPSLTAARFNEAAARYDVRNIEGLRLPSVAASAGLGYSNYTGPSSSVPPGNYFVQNVGVSATVPLYQAGIVGSQVRQAQERRNQLMELIDSTSRQVVEGTTNAYSNVQTARATIDSADVAVRANTLALEGVKQENLVGSRTVLEVLNAEQELLSAQVTLVQAHRDEYVAAYQLLANMGQAEAQTLDVPVTVYDPTLNAKRVSGIWSDWSVNPGKPALSLPPSAAATHSVVPLTGSAKR